MVVGFAKDLLGDLFPPVWVDRSCFDALAIILFTRFTTCTWLISFILPIKKNNDKHLFVFFFDPQRQAFVDPNFLLTT